MIQNRRLKQVREKIEMNKLESEVKTYKMRLEHLLQTNDPLL